MNIVIYARFSSHSQTEQSIEGQLKVCREYAAANGHIVVGEYIDRAQTGKTDNRADFQRMLSDSEKHTFEAVLVYQLDRFARNRYDSAINKARLKKNGVRVISAKENITDDASGILVEGVLESMAEYYSAELSQKIHRGMNINAEKCLSNGSNPGLGFKVNPDRTFRVDEDEAKIVNEVFERYASGETVADIIRDLNTRKIMTSLGHEFNKNSLHRMLRNKRYIGTYLYKGCETPNGMPRIVEDDLFNRVQTILDKNKAAPGRTRGKGEYLLTTKLFCGYCKEMMIGYGGTGKVGKPYHYYACKKAKKKLCNKRIVNKELIEDSVISQCLKYLNDDDISFIAKQVASECANSTDTLSVKNLRTAIKQADDAIENLWRGIEQGQSVEMLTERIKERQAERDKLAEQLAIEENNRPVFTEPQVMAFLNYIKNLPHDDILKRRTIINIFVSAIYLYDDHYTLIFNAGGKKIRLDNLPLDDIESAIDGECSSVVADAPPKIDNFRQKVVDFYLLPIHYSLFTKNKSRFLESNK
ncbi:MAG: recombinase family protein [Ruminococcus sp.]|nr:recombinase family protein [Candidatus Copronaster equi]